MTHAITVGQTLGYAMRAYTTVTTDGLIDALSDAERPLTLSLLLDTVLGGGQARRLARERYTTLGSCRHCRMTYCQ